MGGIIRRVFVIIGLRNLTFEEISLFYANLWAWTIKTRFHDQLIWPIHQDCLLSAGIKKCLIYSQFFLSFNCNSFPRTGNVFVPKIHADEDKIAIRKSMWTKLTVTWEVVAFSKINSGGVPFLKVLEFFVKHAEITSSKVICIPIIKINNTFQSYFLQ